MSESIPRGPLGSDSLEQPTLPPASPQTATLPPSAPLDSATTTAPSCSPAAQEAGRSVPGYEVVGELGRGGMGVVYKARQLGLNRLCALKMILAGGHAGEGDLARFKTEAEAIARLQHRNIVTVYEVGAHEGKPFLSLEYCPGGSLDRKLGGTPIAPREAADLVRALAEAMQVAHAAKVIHRDLKPANVLLAADGSPRITDFGLARKLDEDGRTATGSVMGTPSYMAPEQAEGKKEVGPSADVYALGAILYECLTGRPPFRAATPFDTIMQVVTVDPVAPSRLQGKVPFDLETICLKCLHKNPARRYQTAGDLADDLARFSRGEPIRARPVSAFERSLKWVKRRPATAGMLFTLFLATVALFAGGLWYNKRLQRALGETQEQRDAAEEALGQKEEANRKLDDALTKVKTSLARETAALTREKAARGSEKVALDKEMAARREAITTLADSYTSLGLVAGEQGRAPEAVLYFANAARTARDDPRRDWANRVRARQWLRLCYQPVAVFPAGAKVLRAAHLHPGGRFALTVAPTDQTTLWKLDDLTRAPLPGGDRKVSAAAWSADGKRLALGLPTGIVEVFSFPAGERVAAFAPQVLPRLLLFSRDGRRLAVGGDRARVWDVVANKALTEVLSHPQPVEALCFDGPGDRLATTCRDRLGRVFAVPGGSKPTFDPVPHVWFGDDDDIRNGKAIAPRFIDRDRGLLTVAGGSTVAWRDSRTGQVLRNVPFRSPEVIPTIRCLDVSPTGEHFVIGGYKSAQLYDAETAREVGAVMDHEASVLWAAFSPDGRKVLTCGHDKTVRMWSVPAGKPVGPHLPHKSRAYLARFDAEGDRMLTVQEHGPVQVWTHPPPNPNDAHLPAVDGASLAALSPDGAFVLASGMTYISRRMQRFGVWQVATGRRAGPVMDAGHPVTWGALSPDNRHAAVTASPDYRKPGNLQVWDWRDGKRVAGPLPLTAEPRGVAYRPDGKQVAVICSDGTVWLYSSEGKLERRADHGARMDFPQDYVHNCALTYSPDGKALVSWVGGHTIRVWDTQGRPLYPPLKLGTAVVAVSPDGRWFSDGRTVWDLPTGKPLAHLRAPEGWAQGAQFTRDGRLLNVSGPMGLVRLWDWRNQREVCAPMLQGGSDVYATSVSHDGRIIATGGSDKTVRLWDGRDGQPLSPPLPAGGPILNVALTPNADHLVAGGFVFQLRVWSLSDLSEKDSLSADDLVLLGEILSKRTLLPGGSVTVLDSWAWEQRYQRFRKARPHYFEPDRGDPRLAARLLVDRPGRHEREFEAAYRDRQFVAALYHLDRVLTADPKDPANRSSRLTLLLELGRWKEACAEAEVLERDRPAAWLTALRAVAYLREGDEAGYRKACERLAERYGSAKDFTALSYLTLALVAGPANKTDRLIPALEQAAATAPNSCAPSHLLGPALCRAGRHKEAVAVIEKALRLHPGGKGEPTDLVFMALAQYKLGNAEQARNWLARADQLLADPEDRKRAPLRIRLVAAAVRAEVAAALPPQ